jgi:hypothetical protein
MTYYNFITYEILVLIMAIAVITHIKKDKTHIAFSIATTVLTIFLCTIAFWWMVDTVVYLKYEILKSPLVSSAGSTPVLPT